MARKKKKLKYQSFLFIIFLALAVYYIADIAPTKILETLTGKKNTSSQKESPLNENNNFKDEKNSEKENSIKQVNDHTSNKKIQQKQKIPPIPVKEKDDQAGEIIAEGQIVNVDEKNWTITIEQNLDDNSVKINPIIKIGQNAVIQNNNGKIKISDIPLGATVGVIIDNNGVARSVTVIN